MLVKLPAIVKRVAATLGQDAAIEEVEGSSVWARRAVDMIRQGTAPNGYDLWSRHGSEIERAGGALVYSVVRSKNDPKGALTETIVRLVYPRHRGYLRSLFEVENFGTDIAESFGYDADNSKRQILKRRKAAMAFYDEIASTPIVTISAVEDVHAELRLIGEKPPEWKRHWGLTAWNFYREHYAEYGDNDPNLTFTKSACMRGAERGVFRLGC